MESVDETRSGQFASLSNERLIELLRHLADEGCDSAYVSHLREEIIQRNIGLVKAIAIQFLNSGELLDDLVQAGYIGLLNAVTNFDLARNILFSTYATYLVRGEIRHYIRDKHSTIRVPQWAQSMGKKLKEVEEAFFQENGRPPLIGEIAERMELGEKQVIDLLRGRNAMAYVSIDQERRGQDPRPPAPSLDSIYPRDESVSSELNVRITIAIEQLVAIQQQVIRGLFYQAKSQSELGEELGLSQRQVSRLKEKALLQMKERLGGDADTGD
jgi:RNA polymerase sigma-B factor